MKIKYKKTSKNAKVPYKKFSVDAGYDLFATWRKVNENNLYLEYGTNLEFEIPVGYVGLIFPRSSVTNMDLILKNCVGVIDASYRGEIKFRFYEIDFGETVYEVGDRIGQILFFKLPEIELEEANELSKTERGTAGYGSSGNK